MLGKTRVAISAVHSTLTLRSRAVVDAVLLTEGSIGSAATVAHRLGLSSRYQLARLLRHEGLPPLHRLAGWATVLGWLEVAERDGRSLCWIAFRSRRHPGACYRLVKEITGACWTTVRVRGSAWMQRRFLEEFGGLGLDASRTG